MYFYKKMRTYYSLCLRWRPVLFIKRMWMNKIQLDLFILSDTRAFWLSHLILWKEYYTEYQLRKVSIFKRRFFHFLFATKDERLFGYIIRWMHTGFRKIKMKIFSAVSNFECHECIGFRLYENNFIDLFQ